MAHALKTIPAKPAFGTLTNTGYHMLPFNKTNLIAGQYSKMNLINVCTVSNGSPCSTVDSCSGCSTGAIIDVNSTKPFYQVCTIDPQGKLFGKTPCGINNFTNYMVYDHV